jgi:hypothetical protein
VDPWPTIRELANRVAMKIERAQQGMRDATARARGGVSRKCVEHLDKQQRESLHLLDESAGAA